MSVTRANCSPEISPFERVFKLTGLFWASSYLLLTLRGALFHDDWSNLLDQNRMLTVTAGAVAYALVLDQIECGPRLSLRGALSWILGATAAIMIVRFGIDQLMFDVPLGAQVNMLFSLTWSAYFALWVMGALAFAPPAVITDSAPFDAAKIETLRAPPASVDGFELLAEALLEEAANLRSADRAELAKRIGELGGLETIDGSTADNDRARLAMRLATRLQISR